jgi:AraC family transcriptional regulator
MKLRNIVQYSVTEVILTNGNDHILSHKLFLQREYKISHLAYDREMEFYNAVKDGDFLLLKKLMIPLENNHLGKLSSNPLRNLKYHLIITTAMITRFCIEGGLSSETAYTLSDIYIQQIDTCSDEDAVNLLHREIIFDFADRMKKLKTHPDMSRATIKATDFIYDHLQEKISLEEIASASGLNKTYLCALFKKETGMTVQNYVMKLRIEAAENMLMYADYSSVAISNYFMFSSLSHFIRTFKKFTGMTPNEYRRKNYRRHWEK